MRKKVGYSILIFLTFLLIAGFLAVRYFNSQWFKERPLYLEHSAEERPMEFIWSSALFGNYKEPHNAILIPFKVAGLPHKFTLQFDSGASSSYLHAPALKSLRKLGISLPDTSIGKKRFIKQLDFDLGGCQVNANMMGIYEGYGQQFTKEDTGRYINIGTIGSDFLTDRIVVVDFINHTLQLFEDRPSWMDTISGFQSFSFDGRRFMLPATIRGKSLELFYDSGSSAYGLITSKDRYDHFTKDDKDEITHATNRRGETLTTHHKATKAIIVIGSAELPLRRVSYVAMYAEFQKYITPFTRIGGWLGNKPFLRSVLIIDTRAKEFVVLPKP